MRPTTSWGNALWALCERSRWWTVVRGRWGVVIKTQTGARWTVETQRAPLERSPSVLIQYMYRSCCELPAFNARRTVEERRGLYMDGRMKVVINGGRGPGRYSDRSLFRQIDIPTGRCSDRSIFRQTGRYSDRSLFRQVDIPTGRYSDRSIFRQTGRYSDRSIVRQTGRYSDRSIVRQTGSIFRKVYIPTGRYSDIKIIVMRGLTTINSYCGDEYRWRPISKILMLSLVNSFRAASFFDMYYSFEACICDANVNIK